MIPLVEFAMETPVQGPQSGHTTGTINPGVIWFGRYLQLGPRAADPGEPGIRQERGPPRAAHFYLDDILPNVFSWTPFHGILGPTQPR
jgi:hypothetical protein